MSKNKRLVIASLFGFFFSVATLEIDIFDYDNTFFDAYDSYVKIDSKATQRILTLDFERLASPEIIAWTYSDSSVIEVASPKEPRSSNYFYRPKLFLIKSSLLI